MAEVHTGVSMCSACSTLPGREHDENCPNRPRLAFPNPDQTDWEYTVRLDVTGYKPRASRNPRHDDYIISVTKLGGGTLGRAYPGSWYVRVVQDNVVKLNDRMTSHSTFTHYQAADQALGFVLDDEANS